MDEVTPNEIARTLGVSGLTFRNWLRSEKAADHPLLAGHEYGKHYKFSPAEADQLIAEYRSSGGRGRAPGQPYRPAGSGTPRPARFSVPSAAPARETRRVASKIEEHSLSEDPGHRVTEMWMGEQVLTLADLLRPGLRAVIIGINPSPVSVAAGHYYQGANGKRWWAALRAAGILPDGDGFEDDRLFASGIGFTDLVKRATARETGLRPGEREHGRRLLEERLADLAIERVLFVYKSSAKEMLSPFRGWGLRPGRPVAGAEAWVMCGPMAPSADRAEAIRQLGAWWRG